MSSHKLENTELEDKILLASNLQRKVSDPNASVYISASAGTGKTKVLVDRILRLLMSGTHPNNLLCLTFTNAAADELISRLKNKLALWMSLNDLAIKAELQNLTGLKNIENTDISFARQLYGIFLDNIENIKIQTLHAFCNKVLTLCQVLTDNTNIRTSLIDSFRKKQLIEQAYLNVLQNATADFALQIKKLANIRDHETLLNDALEAINKMEVEHNSNNAGFDIFTFFHADKSKTYDALLKSEVIRLAETGNIPAVTLNTLCHVVKNKTDKNLVETLEIWQQSDLKDKISIFDQYIDAFLTSERVPRKKLLSKEVGDKYPEILDALTNEQSLLYQVSQKLENQKAAEISYAMQCFTMALKTEIEKLKTKHGYAEYDDLLIQTFNILSDSIDKQHLLYKLDSMIDHVLVDEAQDLSPLQWDLIKLLTEDFFSGDGAKSTNRTVFIVGDFKQSIFGFQGASPEIFCDIKKFYRKSARFAQKKWVELDMNISFRSSKKVLNLVDNFFNDSGHKTSLGASREENIMHLPSRDEIGAVYMLPLLEAVEITKNDNEHEWEIPDIEQEGLQNKEAAAARALASHIKNILSYDSTNLKASDIMVLVRKRSALEDHLIAELKHLGISCISKSIRARNSLIIQDLLSLAKFIAMPHDDLTLACLLKSPFFSISEEDLFSVAYVRGDNSLLDSIRLRKQNLASLLDYFFDSIKDRSFYKFYSHILYGCKYLEKFVSRFGDHAASPIEKFLDKVMEYEVSASGIGIEHFVDWMVHTFQDSTISNDSAFDTNSIRIMTIHGAKGLQAKVVILADAAHSENAPNDSLALYKNHVIYGLAETQSTISDAIKLKNRLLRNEENIRLLYVALTRAEDKLYIFGFNNKNIQASWYSLLHNYAPTLENTITCSDMIDVRKNLNINDAKHRKVDAKLYNHQTVLHKVEHDNAAIVQNTQSQAYIWQMPKRQELTNTAIEHNNQYNDEALRGIVIHKILQNLEKIESDKWQKYTEQYIKGCYQIHHFSAEQKNATIAIILKTIKNFHEIISSSNTFAEISILDSFSPSKKLIRIDKIIAKDNVIEIVEFKTNNVQPIEELGLRYYSQLEGYKLMIQKYFKEYSIKLSILSLYSQQMIEINIFNMPNK